MRKLKDDKNKETQSKETKTIYNKDEAEKSL